MGDATETMFDISGLPEVLFEEIGDLSIHNGIFRCTLYAYKVAIPGTEPVAVPVMTLALPVASVAPCARKALAKVGDDGIRSCKEFVRERINSLLH